MHHNNKGKTHKDEEQQLYSINSQKQNADTAICCLFTLAIVQLMYILSLVTYHLSNTNITYTDYMFDLNKTDRKNCYVLPDLSNVIVGA
jgi:hypothetical protein